MPADSAKAKTGSDPASVLVAWGIRHPYWVIGILLGLGVGPFIDKAVHIDDPLFVWTAEQIQKHPADFYGFAVNWFGSVMPMTMATCNPPLDSYVLAAAMAIFGPGEIALHLTMVLAAFAACAGMYQLAKMWCERPLMAVVLAMVTPVFLVSGTTLMCDVPMLAFWIWAVVFWERALKEDGARWYLIAGLLAGLAVLTKYSALTLLPLLPVLGLLRKRRLGWWLLWLAVPVVMIGAYELATARMYGQGLISAAADYAAQYRFFGAGGRLAKAVTGLVYLGGCLLPTTLLAPFLWRRRPLLIGTLLTCGGAFGALLALQTSGVPILPQNNDSQSLLLLEMTLMLAGGLHLFLLAGAELWRERDVVSCVAFLWLVSGFLFAAVLNWTVSARSLLPMVPAAVVLVVRRLDRQNRPGLNPNQWLIPVVISGGFSLCVTAADTALANSGRTAAWQIAAEYRPASGSLWFEGHCAFQFYLEKLGGQAVDFENTTLQTGDLLVMPDNNSNLTPPPADDVDLLEIKEFPVCSWLCTVRADQGAGFYGAGGCLPFVVGGIPGEKYYIYKVARAFQFEAPAESPATSAPAKDDALAAAGYEAILRANPNDATTQMKLAEVLYSQKKNQAALAHYRIAVRLKPDQPDYLNNLAWILATSADDQVRNGTEAVRLAEHAAKITQYKKTIFLGTLGAAYAEAGQFDNAIATAQKACANASALGETGLLQRNQRLLALYQSHRAYHEPASQN